MLLLYWGGHGALMPIKVNYNAFYIQLNMDWCKFDLP